MLECKIFYSSNREELQRKINTWLAEQYLTLNAVRMEFTTVLVEDEVSYRLEHTVLLLYVPQQRIA